MLSALLCFCAAAPALAGNAQPDAAPALQTPRPGHSTAVGGTGQQAARAAALPDSAGVLSEPEFLVSAMVMSANPELWLKALERAGAAGVPKIPSQLASPEMLADWFYASIEPQYQQAILSRMVDPKKPLRWMQAMSDRRFYMPALATADPATPLQWMKVTADGRIIQAMKAPTDFDSSGNWLRLPASTSPGNAHVASPERSSLFCQPPKRY
jgi:hypothetical protein